MELNTSLYFVNLLTNIDCFLGIIILSMTGISFVGILIFIINRDEIMEVEDEDRKKMIPVIKKWFFSYLAVCLLSCLIPSKNSMYAMLANTYLNKTDIPVKVVQLLDQTIEDLLGRKKK